MNYKNNLIYQELHLHELDNLMVITPRFPKEVLDPDYYKKGSHH